MDSIAGVNNFYPHSDNLVLLVELLGRHSVVKVQISKKYFQVFNQIARFNSSVNLLLSVPSIQDCRINIVH